MNTPKKMLQLRSNSDLHAAKSNGQFPICILFDHAFLLGILPHLAYRFPCSTGFPSTPFSFLVFVDSLSSPRLLNAVCWYAVEFSFWQLLLFIYTHSLKWSHFYFHDFKYELYVHDSQICISNQEMSPELYTHLSHCQTDSFTWISTRYTKVNISQFDLIFPYPQWAVHP